MNEPPYPPFPELSADILSHSLSFLDDEEFMKSASHLEDAYPSSPQLLESTGCRWRTIWDVDQQRAYPQWKPQTVLPRQCSQEHDDESEVLRISRQTGRDFLRDRNMTRNLSKLSRQYYDYNRTPVPFFCPVPTKGVGLECCKDLSPSPSAWPHIQHHNGYTKAQFAFLNASVRDGNCVYRLWEEYRPVEGLSSSRFSVSLDGAAHMQQESHHDDAYNPLELYHWKVARQHHPSQQEQESQEKVSDLQLSTLLRKLQVTIVYDGKLVVATGGCQSVLSSTKGQFHDRPYGSMTWKSSLSSISTTIEFCEEELEETGRVCIQVSRL